MSEILLTAQATSSAAPTAGRVIIYAKTDGYLYFKNDTGVETRVNPQTVASAAEWSSANPVMASGVFGVEFDTQRFKIGDGTTAWNDLAYWRYTAEHLTINTTGGDTVLTIAENRATSFAVVGALVSNVNIIVNNTMPLFVAENLTTGAFTVTFKTAGGSGIEVPQGEHITLYADSVNVENPVTAGAGSGDVVGPASAVSLNFASFDGVTGKLIADSGFSSSSFATAAHAASTSNPHSVTKTQVGLSNVDNTSDVDKPVSTAQAAADTAAENNAKAYADSLVTGLLDDRGNYDASVNTFPAAGGSGPAGAVLKGDVWYISVAGQLGGVNVAIGDAVRALTDAPGQTASNWSVVEGNFGYTPVNKAGDTMTGHLSVPASAAGAQAIQAQEALNRTNHTGTQAANTVTVTSRAIGNSTNLDTALGNLDDSLAAQKDSGVAYWGDAGNYYTTPIVGNQLELLRGGVGYIKGKKVTWVGSQTTGTFTAYAAHWVYIDSTGTIGMTTSRSHALYIDNIILFSIYYDGTNYEVSREDHDVAMDLATMEFIHDTLGTILTPPAGMNTIGGDLYRLGVGTGGVAADRQVGISGNAEVNDGSVTGSITATASPVSINFCHTNGSGNWVVSSTGTEFPMQYNNAGTLTALSSGGGTDTGIWTVYAVKPEPNSGAVTYYAVAHTAALTNDAAAHAVINAGSNAVMTGTLFAALEPAQLAQVIVTNNPSGGYISHVVVAKDTARSAQSGGGATAATGITVEASGFAGNLSASDTNVQAALETIDALSLGGGTTATWTLGTSAADLSWYGVTYGNGVFVAVAIDGTGNGVMTSPDGKNWTARTPAANNSWAAITYGNGLFVAVAYTGTGNRVMTSPDGITWTIRTSAADNSWLSVAYGNGLFVAVSIDGTGNRVMASPDGITWTSRTPAADLEWRDVVYGNGLFVAVASSGTGNRVMTSPDGITWTSRTSAADIFWYSVTYGNGLFVATATTGTGNRVMTSPDGTTWTSRTSPEDIQWKSVAYGNGVFVAVADTGTGTRAMTSPDGIVWTSGASAADNAWRSVVFGNGAFVAVAATGTGNRATILGKVTENAIPKTTPSLPAPTGVGSIPRVNAAPDGYELRTPAQVLTDIGAAALAGSIAQAFNASTINGVTPKRANDIINGQFRVAQAGTSFAAPAHNAYDLDGWLSSNTSAAVFTVAQAAGSSTGKLCRTLTVTTADAAIAAGDVVASQTRIEGYDAVKYLGADLIIGFRVKSSVAGIHCLAVYDNVSKTYVAEYTIDAVNTWEYKTVTIVGGLTQLGSATNGAGFAIRFTKAGGATYQTTAGAWNAGNFFCTANQVNDVETIGNVFALEDVTMNLGTVASVDEITYEEELRKCKRYLPSYTSAGNLAIGAGLQFDANNAYCSLAFEVETRTEITGLTVSSANAISALTGGGAVPSTAITLSYGGKTGAQIAIMSAAAYTANGGALFRLTSGNTLYFTGARL